MLKRVAKSSFFSLSSRGLSTLCNFVIIFAVSRFLDSSQLGVYSIAFFFYYFFSIFSTFGLTSFFGKEIAYKRENLDFKTNVVNEIFTNFFVGLLLSFIFVAIIPLFYKEIEVPVLLVVALGGLLFGVERNLSGVLLGEERMEIELIAQIVNFLFLTVLTFLLIKYIGIIGIFSLKIIASFATIFLRYIFIQTNVFRFIFSLKKFFQSERIYFFAFEISSFILRQVDVFILSFLISKEMLGGYFLALRIYFAFALLPQIFSFSITPFVSRTFNKKEKENLFKFNKRILKYLIPGAILSSFVMWLSRDLMISIFSNSYSVLTKRLLLYLSFALLFRFVFYYTGNFLTATKYQNRRFFITIISSMILVILNVVLGVFYSIEGVIAARIFVELIIFSLYGYFFLKILRESQNEKQ